ncbi:dienelactone hydrolase family protein [Oharaeibacter diazotrophicus]|uniref:Carboxymethylenebutenolidase n=1 Tax=Oharaeibacter diazotrophicus TaxID=1920512 RepID=A0A4R6RNQ1_9HYPH|nr:dienelactone hydrolase family protein [Oharaeibacter diazotrophicus]TDP87697.1 carboxymethylenebutenolidase [Oharaeibacter diazotrophicus]BBE74720.1 carboxymethylenebutenolidase [Pleomorphomonas sp. SM30]GLS77102.1 carboxymethylenebutenolidase [Oharaeibacter diazotrophicus]
MSERVTITPEMIRLYDEYTHVTLDRRGFMEKLKRAAGSAAAAAAIVPLLEANQARAAILAEDDPRVAAETVSWKGASGEMSGYLVKPAGATGKLPAVIVIHENRGLNPHIRDVARRVAVEGFVALAPDFLSPAGGTPADEDQARDMIGKLDAMATLNDAVATVAYLKGREDAAGKVGAVGFCWGGGLVNQLATAAPDLAAGVAYYGRTPDPKAVTNIKAAMLLHYAGLDERINAGIAEYDAALKAAGVAHEIHVYDGVNHAFNNDTSAARYDKAAADLAWGRTIAFFKANLA